MSKKFIVTPEMIKDLRKRHRLTNRQLADSLFHIKLDRVNEWVAGRRNCPPIIYWAMVMTWDKKDIWGQDENTSGM